MCPVDLPCEAVGAAAAGLLKNPGPNAEVPAAGAEGAKETPFVLSLGVVPFPAPKLKDAV